MSLRSCLNGLTFLLVVVTGAVGVDAYFAYESLQAPPSPFVGSEGESSARKPKPKGPEKRDYGVISRRDLFTSAPVRRVPPGAKPPRSAKKIEKPAASRPKAPPAPPPSLNLRLVGTTVGPEGSRFAIIEEKGSRKQDVYRPGDKVQGAVVQTVERGMVRLSRGGRIEVLRAFEENGGERDPRISRRAGREASPFPRRGLVSPSRGSARRNRILPRQRLKDAGTGERDLLRQFRAVPYRDAEGQEGVRVYPTGQQRILRLIGLRGGDVVLKVDGEVMTSGRQLADALSRALGRTGAQMQILRAGKPVALSLQIE